MVLFLDFDGCLVNIAASPESIEIPEELPRLLNYAYYRMDSRVVLVSGRPTETILQYLPSFAGPVYGSHGSEVQFDGLRVPLIEVSTEAGDIVKLIRDFADHHDGMQFEQKPMSFAVHYRNCPQNEPVVRQFMQDLASVHPDLELQEAKMALELKPVGADKGRAILDAMERYGWTDKKPIHIGDDVTDEKAFSVLDQYGGFGVKVGDGATVANYHVPTPKAVRELLQRWIAA